MTSKRKRKPFYQKLNGGRAPPKFSGALGLNLNPHKRPPNMLVMLTELPRRNKFSIDANMINWFTTSVENPLERMCVTKLVQNNQFFSVRIEESVEEATKLANIALGGKDPLSAN